MDVKVPKYKGVKEFKDVKDVMDVNDVKDVKDIDCMAFIHNIIIIKHIHLFCNVS